MLSSRLLATTGCEGENRCMRARVCGKFAPFTEVNGVKIELLSALLLNVDDLSTLGSDKNVDNELYVEVGVRTSVLELVEIGRLTFGLKLSFMWF